MPSSQASPHHKRLLSTLVDVCNDLSSQYEQSKIFHQFLQIIDFGIYTIDSRFQITTWNRHMEKITGLDATSAMGHNLLELFPIFNQSGIAEALLQTLSAGTTRNFQPPDGQKSILTCHMTPLKEKEQIVGALVVVKKTSRTASQIDRAKQVLINQGLSEPEAHRKMQQQAMNHRKSLAEIAMTILQSETGS